MIRRRLRTTTLLVAASLLLSACSGVPASDTHEPKAASAPKHPVFDQKLDRQLLLAVRQTQQAGTTSFAQRLTFTSTKGDLVQTLSGRMDFTAGAGRADGAWETPAEPEGGAKGRVTCYLTTKRGDS